jgi:hypothetical protein
MLTMSFGIVFYCVLVCCVSLKWWESYKGMKWERKMRKKNEKEKRLSEIVVGGNRLEK